MASLTHVCMWSRDGWKQVTADQAAKLHPGGTVSAHSGLFMCELCGQYVLLTDEGYQVRHFRHSSHEKSKNCPERTSGISVYNTFSSKEHDLPIRIIHINSNSFSFELGLLQIPHDLLAENLKIEIKQIGNSNITFQYSKERIKTNGISYVSIGDIPCTKYSINVVNGGKAIYDYWPREVKGIEPLGTLFETTTGRMLPYDSDVEVGKGYYLLSKKKLMYNYDLERISIRQIATKTYSFSTYYVYQIMANSMNEYAAKFFLSYHYRLTDKPIVIQPIWPPFIENSYLIKHNHSNMYLLIKGNTAPLKCFPQTSAELLKKFPNSRIYGVSCQNRQQLISTGRLNALKYTYIWKESITCNKSEPEYLVTDITGNKIESGETNQIPKNGVLRIKSEYDGEIIIKIGNYIKEKRKVKSDIAIEVDELTSGKSIFLYIGLDCVWNLTINKSESTPDNSLVNTIIHSKGKMIESPHSLKNIALFFHSSSTLYNWIIRCIENGKICDSAFKMLSNEYLKRRNH